MAQYFFIGGINLGGMARGGAEGKNQILIKKLQEELDEDLWFVDMSPSQGWMIVTYLKLFIGLIRYNRIILSVASTALEKLSYFNLYLNRKDVVIFIIGGMVDQKLGNPRMKTLFENSKVVFAETKALTESIKNNSSLINVHWLPNFKQLLDFTPKKKSNKDEVIKVVFLSRVHRNKGIFRAIKLIKYLNKRSNNKLYTLDIYGPIDLSTNDKYIFEKETEEDYIHYKGYLNLSTSESLSILSSYHFFIFLTNHSGEGFPGVLIDALHAQIHIIASDWKYNHEIIPANCLLVNMNSFKYEEVISDYIFSIINMQEEDYQKDLENLKKESKKYDIKKIYLKPKFSLS